MLTSLQPHRPQVQPPRPAISLPHQQVRQLQPQLPPSSSQSRSLRSPTFLSAAANPQSQIEAMPPTFAPLPILPAPMRSPIYDPSLCHPVFFTQSLRKPPFPVPDTGGGWVHPVATGYVVEERKGGVLRGKL